MNARLMLPRCSRFASRPPARIIVVLTLLHALFSLAGEPAAPVSDGNGPLHVAAQRGDVERVRELLKKRAPEDARNKRLETPLFLAAAKGHLAVVETLLAAHAGIDLTDTDGATPLYAAAAGGHLAVVNLLLENGAKPNVNTRTGEAALFAAVERGHIDIVRALLEMGSLATFDTRAGETPLSVARKQKNQPMIALLEAAGAQMPRRQAEDFPSPHGSPTP